MLASTITTVKARPTSGPAPTPSGLQSRLLLGAVLVIAFMPPLLASWPAEPPRRFASPAPPADGGPAPLYTERFIDPVPSWPSLHNPTLGALANGDLLAVWKVGEADNSGAAGVALHAATLAHGAAAWGPTRLVTSRRRTQRELGRLVGTLANPVLIDERDGVVRLLYVTAWAKWSTSALAMKTSRDHGVTWSPARRIVANPFGNLATLVKAAPVPFADGTVGVPAYHEFFGVFPQLLRFSADGELLDRVRIDRGQVALQPSIVPLDERHGVALLRNADKGRILMSRTRDAGVHWDPVKPIGLPNPNAPVMAVRLSDGALLVVFNNSPVSRDALSLALSRDGGAQWHVLHSFENNERQHDGAVVNFSYPGLLRASDGIIHLIYVWRDRGVKHVAFNEAWLRERAR